MSDRQAPAASLSAGSELEAAESAEQNVALEFAFVAVTNNVGEFDAGGANAYCSDEVYPSPVAVELFISKLAVCVMALPPDPHAAFTIELDWVIT